MTEQGIQHFRLPDVGEGLTEAEILHWHVRPGDRVEVNQIIVEIETAKAAVELPCPYAGTVRDLLVEQGTTVDVGTPIISVETGETTSGQGRAGVSSGGESEGREPVLVGYGVKEAATRRRPRRAVGGRTGATASRSESAPSPEPSFPPSAPPPRPSAAAEQVSVLAKPPVRKLARDLGVDLRSVTPTGPGGVITREDVRRYQEGREEAAVPAARPAPPAAPEEREERVPVRGVRKSTAAAMVRSAFTAPHVTEFLQVDVTETVEVARRLRERPEFADVRVSPLLLVAKALLTAVRRYPGINASWDEQAQEIVIRRYVNLGIAAATDRGLVVPNIKEAHALPLPDLARELQRLTETARAGKASPTDLSGGTITITNVGVFGVDAGTPILNPGEAAILAFGQIRDLPWVHQGELAVRKVTTLSLSFDHRLVDGELGSKALRDVGAMLEDPLAALAWG